MVCFICTSVGGVVGTEGLGPGSGGEIGVEGLGLTSDDISDQKSPKTLVGKIKLIINIMNKNVNKNFFI